MPKRIRHRALVLGRGPLFAVLAGACGGEGTARVPSSSPPVVHPATVRESSAKDLAPDVPTLHVVLDDPRFSGARERLRAKDAPGAAKTFDDARAAIAAGFAARRARSTTRAGGFIATRGRTRRPTVAFDRVPATLRVVGPCVAVRRRGARAPRSSSTTRSSARGEFRTTSPCATRGAAHPRGGARREGGPRGRAGDLARAHRREPARRRWVERA